MADHLQMRTDPPPTTMGVETPPKTEPARHTRSSGSNYLAVTGLLLAVALAYGNSLQAPFLFDDAGAVVNNPTIRQFKLRELFSPPADGSTTTGRPVVNISYAINHAISGTKVWSYHGLNIAIHAAAALTLMGVVGRTLSRLDRGRTDAAPSWVAPLVAFVWALHPLQTETVVSTAQRTESLCGLFYLLTLYSFIRGTEPGASLPGSQRPAAWRWLALSVVACLAGMGSKEVMATAPLIVFLHDRTFVAGGFSAAWRRRKPYYLALAGTWLVLAALVWQGGGARGASAGFGLGVSWWPYLLKQCEAIPLYLKLSFWPHPLVLDYGTGIVRSLADVWAPGILVVSLLAGTIWALARRPALGFAAAWFFVILAPSSSVIPLVTQTMAEHRMYLPLASIICLVGVGLYRRLGAHAKWLLGAAAAVLGSATIARNQDYRDPAAIWSSNVAHYPQGARGHNNLAVTLQQRGQAETANSHFARAVALEPGYVTAHYNWGVALLDQQRPSEALVQLETTVRLAPSHADARVNLGRALFMAGRTDDAILHLEAALRLKPAADVHFNLGVILASSPDAKAAITHFESALRLQPNFAGAAYALGNVFAREERFVEAIAAYRRALELEPDHFAALANLGNSLLASGRPAEAIATYETALRLRPDDPRLRENLALARTAIGR